MLGEPGADRDPLPGVEAVERALRDMAPTPGRRLRSASRMPRTSAGPDAERRGGERLALDQRQRQRHAGNLGDALGHRVIIGQRRLDALQEHMAVEADDLVHQVVMEAVHHRHDDDQRGDAERRCRETRSRRSPRPSHARAARADSGTRSSIRRPRTAGSPAAAAAASSSAEVVMEARSLRPLRGKVSAEGRRMRGRAVWRDVNRSVLGHGARRAKPSRDAPDGATPHPSRRRRDTFPRRGEGPPRRHPFAHFAPPSLAIAASRLTSSRSPVRRFLISTLPSARPLGPTITC